jgi:sporulation protein YlmC with PRC-barrel domain
MARWNMTRLSEVRGKDIYSAENEKIGSIRDIYYDENSGDPGWVGVGTGFLGMSEKVVPVESLTPMGEHFMVPFTRDKIKDEPEFDVEGDYISARDELKLCEHFGLTGQTERRSRVLRYGETYSDRRS